MENLLIQNSNHTRLIQSHKGIPAFNYDVSVDWAFELLEKGIVTLNIKMLASIKKPTNSFEIQAYVTNVLKEFNLEELQGDNAIQGTSYYYIWSLIHDKENFFEHLQKITEIFNEVEYERSIYPFYLLKYSWEDLQEMGYSYHNEKATFENFDEIMINEAEDWLKNFDNLHK